MRGLRFWLGWDAPWKREWRSAARWSCNPIFPRPGVCSKASSNSAATINERLFQRQRLDRDRPVFGWNHWFGDVVRKGPAQHPRLLSWQQKHSVVGHWTFHRRSRNQRFDNHWRPWNRLRRKHRVYPNDHWLRDCPDHSGDRSRAALLQG